MQIEIFQFGRVARYLHNLLQQFDANQIKCIALALLAGADVYGKPGAQILIVSEQQASEEGNLWNGYAFELEKDTTGASRGMYSPDHPDALVPI